MPQAITKETWQQMEAICKDYMACDVVKPTDNFPCENIEIQGCWKLDDGSFEAGASEAEADIWSLYVHTCPSEKVPSTFLLEHGPLCCFADFESLEAARKAASQIAIFLDVSVADFSF